MWKNVSRCSSEKERTLHLDPLQESVLDRDRVETCLVFCVTLQTNTTSSAEIIWFINVKTLWRSEDFLFLCVFVCQTSLIFDIKLKEPDCAVNTHQPVLPARSIHPYRIPLSGTHTHTHTHSLSQVIHCVRSSLSVSSSLRSSSCSLSASTSLSALYPFTSNTVSLRSLVLLQQFIIIQTDFNRRCRLFVLERLPARHHHQRQWRCENRIYTFTIMIVILPSHIRIDPSVCVCVCVCVCVSGYLWYLQVKLPPTVNLLQDKGKLMDFLLRRRDCKMVILSVCSQSTSVYLTDQMNDKKNCL